MKRYVVNRLGVDANRIHVIINGVNLDTARRAASERAGRYERLADGRGFIIVYVGGLKWYEGADLMIMALSILKSEIPSVRLAIAGRGSME